MKFSCCAICALERRDLAGGAVDELLGLPHVEQRRHAAAARAPASAAATRCRDSSVRREMSSSRSSARRPKYALGDLADQRRDDRAASPLGWPAAGRAPPRWRGGTCPRNRAPRPPSPGPATAPTFVDGNPSAAGGRWPSTSTPALDAGELVGAGDAELRLRFEDPRRGHPQIVVAARAPCGSAPAASRPGTAPTSARRRATAPAGAVGGGAAERAGGVTGGRCSRGRPCSPDDAVEPRRISDGGESRRVTRVLMLRASRRARDPATAVRRRRGVDSRSTSTNSSGMRKTAISVAASMPVITTVPRMRRDAAPEPLGDPQRHAAEDERERGHQDRPQPQPRAFERRVDQRPAPPRAAPWRTRRSGSRSSRPGRSA